MTLTVLTLQGLSEAHRDTARETLEAAGWTPTDNPMVFIQPPADVPPSE